MTQKALTRAQMQEAVDAVAYHASIIDAARALGINPNTFQHRVKQAAAAGITASPTKTAKSKDAEIKRLKTALDAANKDQDTAAKIREKIYGLAGRSPEPPEWLYKEGKGGFRGTPILLASDWHYGEVVNSTEVGGVNSFNAHVAARRIQRLFQTTIALSFEHMGRAKTQYPGIVLALGGDMISGDIHEELAITNDRTPQQCINDLTDLIASGIELLATKFGRVFLPCVVGNHGRNTRKPRMKERIYTSHEWNIYCNLEREFKKNKDIQFFIPGETDAYFRVYGHRYLLTHGDSLGVKGGDGIIGSIGPIMRGAIKVGRSEAQIGRDFDTILMGHWHQYLTLPGIVVNNSLKGYDEFARLALRAPYSRPSQALWFTHPEHGITAHWQVYLEGLRTASDNKEWVSWQQ